MKSKICRCLGIIVILLLSLAVLAACGEKGTKPNLGTYFSKEEVSSWEKEAKKCPYTMNGGYYISFQGQQYPVIFADGTINWCVEPPRELILVDMNQLFSDPSLKNRCARLGLYTETRLFHSDVNHWGFLIDGKRPAYGTVLYMDETHLRQVYCYSDDALIGLDDEIKQGKAFYACDRVVVSDQKGVFLAELNTCRKIFNYAVEQGIPFDAYTRFTNLPYPSAMFLPYDNVWWEEDGGSTIQVILKEIRFSERYEISLRDLSDTSKEVNCIVFTSQDAVRQFYNVAYASLDGPAHGRYKDVLIDDQGKITQCYDSSFHLGENGVCRGALVTHIFYSIEEFNRFLREQSVTDPEKQSTLFFAREEDGPVFDGCVDYWANIDRGKYLPLYAVWRQYRVLRLHEADDVREQPVHIDETVVLPDAARPGYEFEGWYRDASCTGEPIKKVRYQDSCADLYAKFRKVDGYTLTFETVDGKTPEPIQYECGDTFQLPMPAKPFYVFKGWCVDPECKTEAMKTISAEFFGSFHMYPCFEPLTFTVTLVAGDRTCRCRVRYGETTFLLTHITKGNFIGYYDENGVQYTDEDGVLLAPFTDGADIQLFAHYREE